MKTYSRSEKNELIADFKDHVSSGKVATFKKYGMEFVMGHREGAYMWDISGNKKMINCHSNGGVFNLGHRNAAIIQAMTAAMKDFDIGNHHFISAGRARLGKYMASLFPGDLNYTVFGVSGGEAVDLAIKLARGYTGRDKIISIQGGYHGHTGLALAAGDEQYRSPFGSMAPGFVQVPFHDFEAMQTAADLHTAAIILETIPATMGIAIPDKEYLKKIRQLCDEKNILLILDEVQTGLGRTGKLWAFEHFDIIPDIVVIGKGLSGGIYPITATVFKSKYETFFNQHPFIHVSTFGGSEIGTVVAQKVLEISSDVQFLQHVNDMAQLLGNGFAGLQIKYPQYIKGFRQLGLMCGIEFCDEETGPLFTKAAYECDLFSLYANNDKRVCQMLPPLIIQEAQVEEILEKTERAFKKLAFYRAAYTVKKMIGKLPF